MPAAKQTTEHEEIKRWVESHGGHPATVKRTRSKGDVGLIRIDFPGFSGEGSLEPISWDEWFSKFDAQGLAFLYQSGKNTNFNKLVRRAAESPTRGRSAASRGNGASTRRRSARAGRSTRAASAAGKRNGAGSRGSKVKSNGAASRKPDAPRGQSARRGRGRGGLQQLTKAELYARARSAGVPQRSGMSKAELVRALENPQ
jgi:hypothetical protein